MNTRAPTERAAALLAMHAGPGFVLPDAWDAGSARILEQVGFRAIATTSAGIAWSCGLPDGGGLDRDGMLEQVNARTDTYFAGTTGDAFAETVERAVRYVEVGADCIFVPGVVEPDTIRRLAAAIPGPLNVVAGLANTIDAPTLFTLGVTRVSLGGSLPARRWPARARGPRAARLGDSGVPRRRDRLCGPAATTRCVTSRCLRGGRPRGPGSDATARFG